MSLVELIRACAETNDDRAWEEFVARTQRPISLSIRHTAMQWGKDPQQYIEDLLQETYLKLCANRCRALLEFARQHEEDAVMGYIKTIAINLAHDHFKGLHSQKRGGGETNQLLEEFDPPSQSGSLGGPEAMEREIFLKQVDERLQACAAGSNRERDCLIFWFYYLQGMSARAIAELATIELTAKGVESVLTRLMRCVREHLVAGLPDSAAS
jgi:RNA polymerase sigma-70 factor (ECF subfamily)